MATITLKRTDTIERITMLAVAKGYDPTTEVEVTEEMTVESANEQGLHIKEVLEDTTKCIAVTETKEEPNPEIAVEYLSKLYQSMIDNDIKAVFLEEAKKELREKQLAEEKALEEAVSADIWETKIA